MRGRRIEKLPQYRHRQIVFGVCLTHRHPNELEGFNMAFSASKLRSVRVAMITSSEATSALAMLLLRSTAPISSTTLPTF
jgi:hypothetical protein